MVSQFCAQQLKEYKILIRLFETVIAIRALCKSSSIPTNLKKLFLSLAFSDLAVGLFAQLMLGAIVAVMLKMGATGKYRFDFYCRRQNVLLLPWCPYG